MEATVPSIVRETVNAVQRRITDGQDDVSLPELAENLKLDKATVSRRVRAARDRGYLKDLETKRGRPSKLVLGDPMPEDQPILPSVEDLALQCCSDDGGVKASPSHELCASEVALDDADLEERLAIQSEPPVEDLTEILPQFERSGQRNS